MRYLNLLLLVIVWGSYYVANKLALTKFSVVFTGVFIRFFVLLIMLLYMGLRKELKTIFKTKYVFARLVLIGLLGFLLDFTAFLGFKYSTASKGAILLRSDVLFSSLISFFLGEKFYLIDIVLTVMMLVGVFMVSGLSIYNFSFNFADIFFLLSALFISINAFVIRGVQNDKENRVSDNVIAFYNNFFTMIFFLIFFGKDMKIDEFAFLGSNLTTMGLLLASVGQFLIYIVYYYTLRIFPVWLVRSSLLLMPVYVSLFSFIFLNERLSMIQILGMATILLCALGLIINQKFNVNKVKR